MVTRAPSQVLLRTVLKSVSRSFYLTLAVLPADVRAPVSLAYLLARAADTIADTDVIDPPRRLHYLNRFREWVREPSGNDVILREIQAALHVVRTDAQTDSSERALLAHLEECGHLLETFAPEDRKLVRGVLGDLTAGMQDDLTRFPGTLTTLDDLDRYTYYAAGCVGDFWTRIMCVHRPALREWDVEAMARVGVRFGKGLQYTNVLKDLATDLQRGRCYIPTDLLNPVGLTPADLLDPASLPKFRPVLAELLRIALEHLDQGWLYTMAISRREVRLRLACAWPILFAVKTLRRVSVSDSLLDPEVATKMTRGEVYRIMALTGGALACERTLTAYYGHLRKRVAC